MNDKELLTKKLTELSYRAYEKNYNTFSQFLNIDEISTLNSIKLSTKYTLFGGYNNSERCVCGFGNDVYEYEFPIVCIKISPLNQKFADKLTHRDFLGSLMNLGINRNTLGDIVIYENIGYLFCLDTISDYIIDSLKKVRHTSVKLEIIDDIPNFINKEPESEETIVSSLRVDSIVAGIYKLSRNDVSVLFSQEKIFINSKVISKESVKLNENDIVSVRGYGKFIFVKTLRTTKKDRLVIEVKIYK